MTKPHFRCDIIIPVWNQLDHTRTCIENLVRNTGYPYRLVVIDNASDADTRDYLAGLSIEGRPVTLIRNSVNAGFVKAVNQGLKISEAPYVCLLNNDTIPAPGWLERLIDFAEAHEDVGLMNPVCDGHIDHSTRSSLRPSALPGTTLSLLKGRSSLAHGRSRASSEVEAEARRGIDAPIEEYAKRLEANRGLYMEMNQCFGFCMLIKRDLIDKIGYLDEAFGIGGFDDTDYSMRAHKAGYRSVCVHDSYVYHKQHVSFSAMGDRKKLVAKGEAEYFRKWPRHLRVGVSFPVRSDTRDEEIARLLEGVLFMAREWCWVNLWVSGDIGKAKESLGRVSEKVGMPLHQNIKFNYLPAGLAGLQVLARLLERSFGTKRRKKYDSVLVNDERCRSLLNAFKPIHRTDIRLMRLTDPAAYEMAGFIEKMRSDK